jgi:uncharacterized Zn finger protein (UPF0148 family)
MIQTECTKCGNKRVFEDSYDGRKFKCPICSSPVKIQKANDVVDKATVQKAHENNNSHNLVNSVAEKKLHKPDPSTTNSQSDILPDIPSEDMAKLGDIVNDPAKVNQKEKKKGRVRYVVLGAIAVCAFIFLGKLRNDNFNGNASSSDISQSTEASNQIPQPRPSTAAAMPPAADTPAAAMPVDTAAMPDMGSSKSVQDNDQNIQNYTEITSSDEHVEGRNTTYEDINRIEVLKSRIKIFYQLWESGSIQTADYFAEKVDVFFNKRDVNKNEVKNTFSTNFREFVNFKLDLLNINFDKTLNGVSYFKVKMHFKCFRVKMQKFEECDDTELIGIDSLMRVTYLKEEKIENLRFYK